MGSRIVSRTRSIFAAVCVASAAAGCGSGVSTSASSSAFVNDLANPPEVVSSGGVARVALSAAINPATGGPGIEYAGAFVPPTIRVNPGDTIDITYADNLPAHAADPLNSANLHFHGLATSPNPPADDPIDMFAMPGQTLHYVVPVPKTEPPGLYYYHSHSHGEANWQLYNGMAGAIVVNGTASYASETAGLPERVIVLMNVLKNPQFADTDAARRRAAARARQLGSVHALANDGICQQPFNIDGEYTTINGHAVGVPINMVPGTRQLWRVVNASADGYYDVSLDGQTLQLVARDGVPLKSYPGGQEQNVSDIVVPPAGRAEFVVTGPRTATAFRTTCVDTGPAGDPNPSQVLAIVTPSTPGQLATVPAPGPTAPAIGTFETALGANIAQQRILDFTENDQTGDQFYLNGVQFAFSDAPLFVAQSGTVERWALQNETQELHAFHIHQIHFIVQDVDGVAQPPVWRDTLSLPIAHADGTPSVSHVLLDFRDPVIRGTFLFHCHLLNHEDDGMMAEIKVQ